LLLLSYGRLIGALAVTCVAGWFNHKRGAAFGILFTGSSIGGVVFPITVSHLILNVGFD